MYRILMAFLMVVFLSQPAYGLRLKVATKAPETFGSARIIKKMFREIERETGGRVRFKVYYGGVKGTGRDLILKMRTGEIHGGEFTAGELAPLERDLLLMGIPFMFKSYEEVDFVFSKISKKFQRALEKKGYKVLGWIEVGFVYIMSAEPVRGLADLRRRRVWIPEGDRISETYFRAMGVSPIPLPLSDVPIALQTGQIDTVANSFVGAIALQWHTGVRYITELPLLYSYGLFLITRDAYERIPPEDRATVERIVARYFEELRRDIREKNREAKEVLLKRGVKFLPVDKGEEMRLKESVERVTTRLVGREFSGEGLEELKRYLNEYRKGRVE